VLVAYQFQATAGLRYTSRDELTAFFGSFYGVYLNLTTFILQFLLTSVVVGRFGVGGTLQIMPASVMAASLASFLIPGIWSAASAKLAEAANRYTLNRTGMELLYLPLPLELRNRTKAFVDIFVDRFARGVGGILLLVLTRWAGLSLGQIALVIFFLAGCWILLSMRASREYIATIRKRLELRRLDIASARMAVGDPATLALLERTALSGNPRQAVYALSLLAEVPRYDLAPVLEKLSTSDSAEVRARVYDAARAASSRALAERALAEISGDSPAAKSAASYLLSVSPEPAELARRFLENENHLVAQGALESLAASRTGEAAELIPREWLDRLAADPDPRRRALAAFATGVRGDQGAETLYRLFEDPDRSVVAAACRAAGALRNRAYLHLLAPRLSDPALRGEAIEALVQYGGLITGSLADILEDRSVPVALRRQVTRVLKQIPDQRSVDVLLRAIAEDDLSIRAAALKALNRLRETSPGLAFDQAFVSQKILEEARYYVELLASLAPLRGFNGNHRATGLLAGTLEDRLRATLERLFRLLGLRYPPAEIYSAYQAVTRRTGEDYAAALEFLENLLDRELKQVLLPLLDAPGNALERGRELFGLSPRDAESALRSLICCGDPWLAACAIAAAAELGTRS
ncbi:MAG: hypothetical protein FJW37_13740, partial [Acidobacteria bacterium]|nr:hypothetical protein [Acidobacteriota bacterium]